MSSDHSHQNGGMPANSKSKKTEKKWYHDIADFANLLKSFIGTNYLSLAYGFLQAGLVLGSIWLVIVAVMTVHCCRLIVKVKYHVVRKLVSRRPSLHESIPDYEKDEDIAKFEHLQNTLSYADIGGIAYGRAGVIVVNTFLLITQIGFCVNYHIFIGSNLYSLLWNRNDTHAANHTSNESVYLEDVFVDDITTTNTSSTLGGWVLSLLVISPLPLFIVFVLIRRVRIMGPISFVANGMMAAGYLAVVAYIIATFSLGPDIELAKWATLPVFLGQTVASYEAIGTILSVEASMEGNHSRYPACLFSVVGLFSVMLAVASLLGYLRFGGETKQILVQNLPQDGGLTFAVNIALIIAILFTYPLQVFPVIEILEAGIFLKASSVVSGDIVVDEDSPLISNPHMSNTVQPATSSQGYITKIPDSVPTWKRNALRVSIALLVCVLAVFLRNVFAYVNALVGALGSCPLAFILPALFHLKICGSSLHRGVIIKDVCLVVIGSIMGVVSVVVVAIQMIGKLS